MGIIFNNFDLFLKYRLVRSIVLSGNLYIFKNKICFFSYFNDKNLLFGRTYIILQLDDITKIEKK